MKARTVLAALALLGIAEIAQAAERPENPRKQTEAGLYLTATEAAAMKAESGDAVLFIDVRDPIEIMFTGFAEPVDANIPFKGLGSRWRTILPSSTPWKKSSPRVASTRMTLS